MSKKSKIKRTVCTCTTPVVLELVGGQYQNTWFGTCSNCNTDWTLSAEKDELDIEPYKSEEI